MDRRRAWALGSACATALVDGLVVGGWLASRELDDRPPARRAVRAGLWAAFAAQSLGGELAWQRLVGPLHPAAAGDRRALGQAVAVAAVATAVLSPVHRSLPLALERRGVDRPHLALGVAVGLAYAAATLPVWRGQARRRMAAWEEQPPPG